MMKLAGSGATGPRSITSFETKVFALMQELADDAQTIVVEDIDLEHDGLNVMREALDGEDEAYVISEQRVTLFQDPQAQGRMKESLISLLRKKGWSMEEVYVNSVRAMFPVVRLMSTETEFNNI